MILERRIELAMQYRFILSNGGWFLLDSRFLRDFVIMVPKFFPVRAHPQEKGEGIVSIHVRNDEIGIQTAHLGAIVVGKHTSIPG
jgi:hypothetical protein